MLATESYTLDEAITELDDRDADLAERQDDLDNSTDEYEAIESRRDRLTYFKNGLEWQRDEEGWGGDAIIELGALTAGEKAMMHREATDGAGQEEMRLWFVATSTAEAPYAGDDLAETFANLANCHPGFAEWAEGKTNSLGVPGKNRSSTSSRESETSATSADGPDSTTSSSSDSPTA